MNAKLLPLFFVAAPAVAQTVSNVNASLANDKIAIKYDLAAASPLDKFQIRCFYSTDEGKTYANELTNATGAIGAGQSPAAGKIITWDVKKDVTDFDGQMKFKVHASIAENYSNGKSVGVQLTKAQRFNDKTLSVQGYFFGNVKAKLILLPSSIIRDSNSKTYKLLGGKIDNQEISNSFDVVEGDNHFFDLQFAILGGETIAPGSPALDLALIVFNDEKMEMRGLSLKIK